MEFDDLVRTITREVLRQLQPGPAASCVMVLAERENWPALPAELMGDAVELIPFGDKPSERVVSRYVLPRLSCTDLADLATGRATGACMETVLNLLLEGEEVEVLTFDHRRFSETAPGPLYALYEGYVKTVAAFGLVPFRVKPAETIRLWDDLVTEASVRKVHQQGASVLLIPRMAKITPLALENAALTGLKIQKCL